jgi:hypothetical protein
MATRLHAVLVLLVCCSSGNLHAAAAASRERFFPDGHRLASGLSDTTIVVWDLTSPLHVPREP